MSRIERRKKEKIEKKEKIKGIFGKNKEKTKEEAKEEVKEEAKEEVKEEVKEEAKEEAKEEVKEEAKEEVGLDKGDAQDEKEESEESNQKSEPKDNQEESNQEIVREDDNQEEDNQEEPVEKKGSKIKKVFFGFILFLILAYLGTGYILKDRFYYDTKIDGINVGLKTQDEARELLYEKAKNYEMTINGRKNTKDVINGNDINLEAFDDNSLSEIKQKQPMFLWAKGFIFSESYDKGISVNFDDDKLNEIIKNMNVLKKENIVEPKSAYPAYSETEKKVIAVPEENGSKPDESKLKTYIVDQIGNLNNTVDLNDSGIYVEPKNKKDNKNLQESIKEIQNYMDIDIVYDFEYEKKPLTKEEICNMFKVEKDDKYQTELDKNLVREFVRSLSRKYSTYGDTRTLKDHSGEEITVSGGVYGWLIDREKETDALYDMIKNKKSETNREPIYYQRAASRGKDDLGNTYIEIDISEQMMWLILNGETVISTSIVTGDPTIGQGTPTGIYPINYKQRNATLKGPGYSSPVSYWMPFNGNIGIHDAPWKSWFGGSQYIGNGSHGCINTPYSKVQYIYNHVEEGDPVVVHN